MKTIETQDDFSQSANGIAHETKFKQSEMTPQAEDCLSKADAAYKNGDLAAACLHLQHGLKFSPRNFAMLECLGNIQFQMEDHRASLKSFQFVRGLEPDNVDLLVRLAVAAAHCGDAEEFEKTMERVFQLDSDNLAALRFLAKLNIEEEHYELASQQLSRILKREPADVDSLINAGKCYVKLNRPDVAAQMFESVLRLDKTNAIATEKLNIIRIEKQIVEAAKMPKDNPPPTSKPANNLESLITEIRNDKIARPHYAHGLLLATLQAMKIGVQEISVFEFGVLRGDGLLNLCSICQRITDATGFKFRIYGFDSDVGMPPITDYRDHPEIWYTGQFKVDHALTKSRLPANAELIVGDIAKTIIPFTKKNLSPECPVGFVAIDVDLYSSTKSCFKLFKGKADCYLPAVVMYFDDVNDMITLNSWCGEALAVKEFNRANKFRKIEEKWTRQNSPNAGWHDQMYCCHVLDHPVRSGKLKCASLDLNVTVY